MKPCVIALLAWLLAVTSLAGDIDLGSGIAAVVNDAIVTYREVLDLTFTSEQGLFRQYRNKPERYMAELRKIREDGLELLIERQLILQEYKNTGPNVLEGFIEDQIKVRIREQYGDRVNLTKQLQSRGMTHEVYRQRVRDQIIEMFMRQRNIGSALIISPAKIEQYYQANQTNYNVGDQVKLRVIVLNAPTAGSSPAVQKLAQEIMRKIDLGTAFKEMAAVYSEGSARQEGGDWGWRDRSYLMKGLSDIVFSLNPGQRSSLIGLSREAEGAYWVYQYDAQGKRTAAHRYSVDLTLREERKLNGVPDAGKDFPEPQEYYLMQVEDKRPAHVKPLPEVQVEIEKELLSKEHQRLQKKWIGRLRAKSFVRYYM